MDIKISNLMKIINSLLQIYKSSEINRAKLLKYLIFTLAWLLKYLALETSFGTQKRKKKMKHAWKFLLLLAFVLPLVGCAESGDLPMDILDPVVNSAQPPAAQPPAQDPETPADPGDMDTDPPPEHPHVEVWTPTHYESATQHPIPVQQY